METYIVIGIAIASFMCGVVIDNKPISFEKAVKLVVFFGVVMFAWPIILMYMAPSVSGAVPPRIKREYPPRFRFSTPQRKKW
jgi:hypothetical protein